MRKQSLFAAPVLLAIVFVLGPNGSAQARPIEVEDGWWRLEIQGVAVIHSKKTDREGDFYGSGYVEYEMPTAAERLTFGLRAYPLFVYEAEQDTIFGVAGGFSLRLYQNAENKDGFYAEAGSNVLWHSHHFTENSTRINFLSELGLGYKFPDNPWNISLKYQHISNASTGNDNAGVNGFSLGVGYRF